ARALPGPENVAGPRFRSAPFPGPPRERAADPEMRSTGSPPGVVDPDRSCDRIPGTTPPTRHSTAEHRRVPVYRAVWAMTKSAAMSRHSCRTPWIGLDRHCHSLARGLCGLRRHHPRAKETRSMTGRLPLQAAGSYRRTIVWIVGLAIAYDIGVLGLQLRDWVGSPSASVSIGEYSSSIAVALCVVALILIRKL